MIVTQLDHFKHQVAMNAKFERALAFLQREGWRNQPDGKIEIDGNQVFALLQSYESKVPQDTVPFEGHRKYIDIQYIIAGKETIYWTPTDRLTPTIPYDDAKDIWFRHVPIGDGTPVVLSPGQLAVLFPEDAHAPTYAVGKPAPVKKIIVKVAV